MITADKLVKLLLDKQVVCSSAYVADDLDTHFVCVDGWFNFEKLAELINQDFNTKSMDL